MLWQQLYIFYSAAEDVSFFSISVTSNSNCCCRPNLWPQSCPSLEYIDIQRSDVLTKTPLEENVNIIVIVIIITNHHHHSINCTLETQSGVSLSRTSFSYALGMALMANASTCEDVMMCRWRCINLVWCEDFYQHVMMWWCTMEMHQHGLLICVDLVCINVWMLFSQLLSGVRNPHIST